MINKKARISLRVVIFGIVAVVILFLTFGSGLFPSMINKLKIILPGFDDDPSPIKPSQQVRYNIDKDIVEYYTGSWYDFETPEKKLGDKIVSESILYNDLVINYYHKNGLRATETIQLGNLYKEIYTEEDVNEFLDKSGQTLPLALVLNLNSVQSSGDVFGIIINTDSEDRKSYGSIELTTRGDMFLSKAAYDLSGRLQTPQPIEKTSNLYLSLAPKMDEWRNSIFEKAVLIHYTFSPDRDTNENTNNAFCVLQKDSIYLVVNLALPASQDPIC